jgi:hypothetical protein
VNEVKEKLLKQLSLGCHISNLQLTVSGNSGGGWNCGTCTFINPLDSSSCAMCGTPGEGSQALNFLLFNIILDGLIGHLTLEACGVVKVR